VFSTPLTVMASGASKPWHRPASHILIKSPYHRLEFILAQLIAGFGGTSSVGLGIAELRRFLLEFSCRIIVLFIRIICLLMFLFSVSGPSEVVQITSIPPP
jgi:hypothetical protein